MFEPSTEAVARVHYDASCELEAMRWEYHYRALELERRARMWRLFAGAVGFTAGLLAGIYV